MLFVHLVKQRFGIFPTTYFVDAIEVMDPSRKAPTIQPWLKQALIWAVGGLGFTPEEAIEVLGSDD